MKKKGGLSFLHLSEAGPMANGVYFNSVSGGEQRHTRMYGGIVFIASERREKRGRTTEAMFCWMIQHASTRATC